MFLRRHQQDCKTVALLRVAVRAVRADALQCASFLLSLSLATTTTATSTNKAHPLLHFICLSITYLA